VTHRQLFLDGTAAAITFDVVVIIWAVFEAVMRFVQRFRSSSRKAFNNDASIVAVGIFGAAGIVAAELSVVAIVVLGGIGMAIRIRVEEKQLIEALGQDYQAFAATHKRLIPHVL
jgi:preprotein translocase subunit Sss1